MSRISRVLVTSALIIAILIGLVWLVDVTASGIWRAFASVDPSLAVGIIAAATTVVTSTFTVMLGRYYERKKEIEAHFRTEKIKIYDEFLRELFKMFRPEGHASNTDMTKFIREWQRKLVLWGGSDVLKSYFSWSNHMKISSPDAKTIFLMDDFFRALRADIGQSSNGLQRGAFANLIIRHDVSPVSHPAIGRVSL